MAQTYLLDTSAFSELMREHPIVAARLAALPVDDRVVICPIVRGEVLYGIGRIQPGKRRENLQRKAEVLFEQVPCEPLEEAVSDRYVQVKLDRQRQGRSLDENDLWIAATALALRAVLVTRDTDYQGVFGLVIVDWSK